MTRPVATRLALSLWAMGAALAAISGLLLILNGSHYDAALTAQSVIFLALCIDPGEHPRGSGMANMADRLEAFTGSLTMTSTPGQGTTVSGFLLCGAPPVEPVQAAVVASLQASTP